MSSSLTLCEMVEMVSPSFKVSDPYSCWLYLGPTPSTMYVASLESRASFLEKLQVYFANAISLQGSGKSYSNQYLKKCPFCKVGCFTWCGHAQYIVYLSPQW